METTLLRSPNSVPGQHIAAVLARLNRTTLVLGRLLAIIGLLILLGYAFMTLADGTLRSLANHPIHAVRDLGGFVAAVAVACCMPLAFIERSNITIRLCQSLFGRRVAHVLDAVAAVAVAVVIGLTAGRLFLYAFNVAAAHETSFMLFVPVAPFWFAVAALMMVTGLVQCLVAATEIATLFNIGGDFGSPQRDER